MTLSVVCGRRTPVRASSHVRTCTARRSAALGARRGRPLHSRLLRARGRRAARCAPVATCRHSECECLPRARASTGAVYRTTYQSCRRRVFIARARTGCAAPRCHNRANAPSSIYTVRRKLVGCAPGWVGGGLTCTLVNQPYLTTPSPHPSTPTLTRHLAHPTVDPPPTPFALQSCFLHFRQLPALSEVSKGAVSQLVPLAIYMCTTARHSC